MIVERPEGNKLTGLYRGKVIQHLPHGRLKVYIPAVYAAEWETHPEMLPSAEQLTPLFAGSNQGNGVFSYPNIGSIVMCQFINGDQNYPLVIGATLGGPNAFGQYLHIYSDIKDENNQVLSTDIVAVNHSSPSHLITAGKTHIRLFEDGRISAITMTPNDVPVEVDFQKKELSTDFLDHDINSQLVMSNRGEISASTNDCIKEIYSNLHINISGEISSNSYNVLGKTYSDLWFSSEGQMRTSVHNLNSDIHSHYTQNNSGNFNIDTHSPSITCNIDAKTTGTMIIDVKSSGSHSKITMNQNGIMEINTTDKLNIIATNQINMTTNITNINSPGGVNIIGNTHITGNLVTTGTTTDVGCTLATHKHPEMQSGDVVSPGVMTGVGVG